MAHKRSESAGGEKRLLGAIDIGTQSTRFIVFNLKGEELASGSVPLKSTHPRPGWVEQDPSEMIETCHKAMKIACDALEESGRRSSDIEAVGISNQRETTVVWDSDTGEALHPAIVWNDSRTRNIVAQMAEVNGGNRDIVRDKCGLPLSSYFSALKLRWLLDNCEKTQAAVKRGSCMFGTVDSWLLWNLCNKEHVTDVTNASRTMLMNLESREWDASLLEFFGIPREGVRLPEIRSSAEVYGSLSSGPLSGTRVAGCLGDQQAALLGQRCVSAGQAKNTYGTGCFVLFNTGKELVHSKHGLLTTAAFQLGRGQPVHYALEGSVATAGAAVSWYIDNLGLIDSAPQLSEEAAKVENAGGMYFVPAFSGLFAPHWREDARGTMVGMTGFITKAHMCRALLDAVALQTREVIDAMEKDSGVQVDRLRVDGGMSKSALLLQIQSDILGIPVDRPHTVEITAAGAALAAGVGIGAIDAEWIGSHTLPGSSFNPISTEEERAASLEGWGKAVSKAVGWTHE